MSNSTTEWVDCPICGEPGGNPGTLVNAGRRALNQYRGGEASLSIAANSMADALSTLIRFISPEQPETQPEKRANPDDLCKHGYVACNECNHGGW